MQVSPHRWKIFRLLCCLGGQGAQSGLSCLLGGWGRGDGIQRLSFATAGAASVMPLFFMGEAENTMGGNTERGTHASFARRRRATSRWVVFPSCSKREDALMTCQCKRWLERHRRPLGWSLWLFSLTEDREPREPLLGSL